MNTAKNISAVTRHRIVKAAGEIFGHKGFQKATIRDIACAANVNLAAVNYHFGGKQGLYNTVIEDIFTKGFERFPSSPDESAGYSPEERLHWFIRSAVYRFLSNKGWHGLTGPGKLIAREFLNPSPAFSDIIDTHIKPHKDILVTIIQEISGNQDENAVLPCALSIMGQCIYYAFAAPVIQRLASNLSPGEENLDTITEHIFQFSLNGIKHISTGDE